MQVRFHSENTWEDDTMILADKIIELRKRNGWSQEELAERLGVSRQAVSKWESAQAIPDIARILEMAKAFSVSTDFLLRDELACCESSETAEVPEITALRGVSMEEAHAYLDSRRMASRRIALATAGCILSPILLILASGTGSKALALSGGAALMLIVAAAVVTFIYTGMRNKPYEYLEEVPIDTAYGVTGMVREQQKAHRKGYMRSNILGVALCILAAIPLVGGYCVYAFDPYKDPTLVTLGVCLAILMVAAAVYLFIRVGVVEESFLRLLEEGDYTRARKRAGRSPLVPAYWCVVTAGYLAWSFLTDDWQITWVVWPVAGLLFAALLHVLQAIQEGKE